MLNQIERALNDLDRIAAPKRARILEILKRYAESEIGLDAAYYELLDEELIPMPQRCAISAKIPVTGEDESRLKALIMKLAV